MLTGGPGTGKTTTVAGLLALVSEQHELATGRAPRIALAAPTGKAAARLQEAVQDSVVADNGALEAPEDQQRLAGLQSSTLHRLLGWRPDSRVRFRHHRGNRLPYDVVVVDETSMVSLTMMARLLEAVRPDARLVLVGDPDQLASVEAGAVLADLVAGFEGSAHSPVISLRTTHRYGEHIGALAQALRVGDADAVMAALTTGSDEVELVDPDDEAAMAGFRTRVTDVAVALRLAAEAGDGDGGPRGALAAPPAVRPPRGPLRRRRLEPARRAARLRAHRRHPLRGVVRRPADPGHRQRLRPAAQQRRHGRHHPRADGPDDGRLRVVVPVGSEVRQFATTRLSGVETVHAMTVHKSQGSQAHTVTVVLPDEESRLLTRELFYTAVTRAQEQVRIVGTEAAIRAAVGREVQRASGLGERLGEALEGF